MKFFSTVLYIFSIIIFISALAATTYVKKDKNLERVAQGKMSLVEYKNHTYVVWSINLGGGIVHDPDCICNKK